MPDLLTHSLVAYCVARPRIGHPLAYLFIVGTVLPDVFTRSFYILWSGVYHWIMPLHTPVGALVLCAILAQFFKAGERWAVFGCLTGGAMLHLLLDLSQKHVAGGYFLLFPFSWVPCKGGFWWPEDSLDVVPFLLAAVCALEVGLRCRRPKSSPAAE